MTAFLESWSLQLRNDTKMVPQLKSLFFIVTSIIYGDKAQTSFEAESVSVPPLTSDGLPRPRSSDRSMGFVPGGTRALLVPRGVALDPRLGPRRGLLGFVARRAPPRGRETRHLVPCRCWFLAGLLGTRPDLGL
jgi:hypothetical protein